MNCFKENTGPVEFGLRATEREMKLESTERRTNILLVLVLSWDLLTVARMNMTIFILYIIKTVMFL